PHPDHFSSFLSTTTPPPLTSTLSLHDALPISFFPDLMRMEQAGPGEAKPTRFEAVNRGWVSLTRPWHLLTADTGVGDPSAATAEDRKSTRLNSSHVKISYAVFCLKKKKKTN